MGLKMYRIHNIQGQNKMMHIVESWVGLGGELCLLQLRGHKWRMEMLQRELFQLN